MTKMDYDRFQSEAKKLVEISDKLYDSWKLRSSQGQTYLTKNQTFPMEDVVIEYHVFFNVAFSVPVMYFRTFRTSTGEILWDESVCNLMQIKEGLTQLPHPIDQTPFYQLHPCQTQK